MCMGFCVATCVFVNFVRTFHEMYKIHEMYFCDVDT